MTAHDALYEKLLAEYDAFINQLATKPAEEIINSSFEAVFKQDILICFENNWAFDEPQITALLALDEPLEELYQNWLHSDVSYMDILHDNIESFADEQIQRNRNLNKVCSPTAAKTIAARIKEHQEVTQASGTLNNKVPRKEAER